jgi:UDP-N-acetylmuramate--alanine ligase
VKDLNNIKNIYFLGIGGIGMSALARYFSRTGKNVAGYDRTPATLTRQLEEEGIAIHYEDSVKLIPLPFQSASETLVILTPAVPLDHSEYLWFRTNGFSILKRSEILGQITSSYKTVAVAGTHGKTTISTMITFIMSRSKQGCSAFLGGIAKNFNSNLLMNPESKWMVTEADEFDRSFLQLHPYVGVVTAMDADHLDIYGNASAMQNAFNNYVSQIDRDGILLMKKDLPLKADLVPKKTYTYSLQGKSDFYAENIRLENKRYTFDLAGPSIAIKNLSLEHPGLLNVENAVAASSVCALLGIEEDIIRKALSEFTGILRRFDYQIKTDELVFIDDYAHHPKEIEATLKSVRELYPDKKITGIFQPHLYSRTRDFAEDFAESLSLLDRLLLLDIYPARELPIDGVTSEIIFRNVTVDDKLLCTKQDVLGIIEVSPVEVLITLGAGDIDKLVEPLRELLLERIS